MDGLREIDPHELVATSTHPFVQHQVDPDDTVLVLALGAALVIDGNRHRTGPSDGRPLEGSVIEVDDRDQHGAIDALLDVANPGSFARPGSRGVECWLGVPGADGSGELVAVGALYRDPSGAGHLRSVTTHPDAAGRGLGTAVSAALTRRALSRSGTATLGVYVGNAPALAVYARLGFRTCVTFRSGRATARG